LIILAFTAIVLLVLSLYPSVMKQATADKPEDTSVKIWQEELQPKYVYPLIFLAVIFTVLVIFGVNLLYSVLLSFSVSVLFYFLIAWLIDTRKRKQNYAFESRMLDFLVLVCNNLKSGFALPNSIEIAAKSVGGRLASEFSLMMSEYRLGMELGEAVSRINTRVCSENLQLFSATVSIAIRTGGSVSEVLERLILTIRKRNELFDKQNALTAQFRFEAAVMSFFPLIAFIILYLIDPKLMLPMVTTPIGWLAIGTIILLELIGYLILRRICAVRS
jgi:tight adherence protein B